MADTPNLYGRFARLYDTDENDPRLYKLVGKIMDKGIDPGQWLDSKIGKRTEAPEIHSTDPRQDMSSMRSDYRPKAKTDVKVEQGKSLPPTEGEILGIDEGLAEPGIGTKIAFSGADPSTRRQFLRGASDTATFGLAEKAGKWAEDAEDYVSSKLGLPRNTTPRLRDTETKDQQEAPDARDYGAMAGAMAPKGAVGRIGGYAGKGIQELSKLGARVGNALGSGTGASVGGAAGGLIGGAASAPLVGGLVGGGQALVNGPIEDAPRAALEAGKATARDPLQMAGGALLGGLGGAAKGIRTGDGRTAEDIRLVEEFGGKPSLLKGAKGGSFEAPVLKNRRGTTSDVGEVAREAGDSIRGRLNAETDRLQREYGEGKRRIAIDDFVATPDGPPQTARRGDTSVTRQIPRESMREMVTYEGQPSKLVGSSYKEVPYERSSAMPGPRPRPLPEPDTGGLDVSPIRAAAEKLLESKRLTKSAKSAIKSEVLDTLDELPKGRMTADELNDFRGKLQDMSRVGEATAQKHFLKLYHTSKKIVDDTEYGQLNATYSKGIEAQKRRHRQLGIGKNVSRTDIEDPVAGKKAARVVRRQDENTATSGQESVDVERFLTENPEFKEMLSASKLMSAKGRLRLGIPDTGGLYERVGGLATRNIEPILGSGVYPLGEAVGGTAAATAPSMIRLLEDAAAQRRKRDEERERMLRGN